jgi:1-acyl-sn-glycerol-3-phosphate acyltransferase
MILLRSVLFNLFFFSMTFLFAVTAWLSRLLAQRYAIVWIRLWARVIIAGARVLCGIHLRVTGLEHIPAGAALIASGHQSAFDTFVWFALLPDCCYVLKQELFQIPLMRGLITATEQIPVDRGAGANAIRALVRGGAEALKRGRQVVIFPEGTRSDPGTVGVLQPGIAALANRSGLPVIPVATDSGLCWSRRAFIKRPGVITIAIDAPLPAGLPREVLMSTLSERFASLHRRTGGGAGS